MISENLFYLVSDLVINEFVVVGKVHCAGGGGGGRREKKKRKPKKIYF